MNLTSSEIEQDFYNLFKDSDLESVISGSIYKSGMRPFNSSKEDVVITFLAGISNQIQSGIVNVNTYVPDITIDGQCLKNTSRCKALETHIKNWLEGITDNKYAINLDRTMQVFAEADINQHFINTRLSFKILIQ